MWICTGMIELLSFEELRSKIRNRVVLAGNMVILSRELNMSDSTINLILSGKRTPGASVLKAFGYGKVVLYRKIAK